MPKDIYQSIEKNKKKDFSGRSIIVIVTLSLLLAACGVPSGRVDGNPDGWEDSDSGNSSDIGEGTQSDGAERRTGEWPQEQYSCGVQELSGYLYEHASVSASAYASAEITIKDYEGERLETEWDEPSAFRFGGEADVVWRYYDSLVEMEAALNEAATQETDGKQLHFLYYTFPLTENEHVLDLYHILKSRFDTEEHLLAAWSADNGKLFYILQETVKEEEGYEYTCSYSRNSRVNL